MEDKKIFIETLSLYNDNPEDDKISKDYWGEYAFSLNEVQGYNKSSEGYTTIDLKNGNRWIIAIEYNKFKELMHNTFNHKTIIDSKAEYEFKEQE
jgi:hypothetical protein